jgi:anaerobic selenocysteine-containing dehydrogenase
MTDTAHYADLVLPATTQLEQTDLHRPYGHRFLQYNHRAIEPLGEARSNWTVMRLLAAAMGYDEPWLRHTPEEAIAEILDATRATSPRLAGITLDRLQRESTVPLSFAPDDDVPFADLRFPTPSGKVELRCDGMLAHGLDPLPDYIQPTEFTHSALSTQGRPPGTALVLLSGAAHHFVSSSFANQDKLVAKEGPPFVEINPADAQARGIAHGQEVVVENARGWCRLRAHVTADVPPGVAVAPKGYWGLRSPGGRNVNWLTSDALADLGGQATFHSNLVQIRPVSDVDGVEEPAAALAVAD